MAPWEPVHNPYIVGNPIRGTKLFFGREDDFAFVKAKFSGGKEGGLIVLCGGRRSGKTSVLFQVLDGRLGSDFLPVLVDMQSMAIANDRQFVRRLLELIETAATAGGLSPGSVELSDSPFADVESYVGRLARSLGDRKLVLAFDEYELIETGIDSSAISTQVLHTLANLIEHRKVFVVFTGSEKLEERSKNYWDMFLSKALHRRISFLSRDDTLRLIREPVAGSVEYADGVPERIYDLTAGQPFYTQVICQSLVDHLNDERKRRVELEDVDLAVDEVIRNPLPQMIFHWNALADLQKLALAIMGELTRTERRGISPEQMLAFVREERLGYRIDPNALNKALDKLFHGDLVHKASTSDLFEFKMDLWRLWAMRMHSVWQVVGEIDQAGGPIAGSGIERDKPPLSVLRRILYVTGAVISLAIGAFFAKSILIDEAGVAGDVPNGPTLAHAGVIVVSTTPEGATVSIDGVSFGTSPVVRAVSVGSHSLGLELRDYRAEARTVAATEGETTAVDVKLRELAGTVVVSTNPSGARVSFEDGTVMTSPARRDSLPAARPQRVTLTLEGYESASYDLRAIPDSTIRVTHVFSRRTAPLAISSSPSGATVNIDGNIVGKTPLATSGVSHGPHDVLLSLDGYKTWTEHVVIPIPNNRLEATLTQLEPATIEFSIDPYGDIYVDGKLVAQAVPFYRLPVGAGTHALEFRNPQFGSYALNITLEPGTTRRVQHKFTEQ